MALQTESQASKRKGFRLGQRLFGQYGRDQKLFIAEGMLMYSANVVTTGVFLSGLLVLMGADDMTVGLIASSGSWSMMLSLVASTIMERVRNRKVLLTWVVLVFRLLTTLPVFLPALMGMGTPTIWVTGIMVVLGNAVFSLYNTGFTIFFMDSLPVEGRASYFYTRILLIRIAYTVLIVAMGVLLDYMTKDLGLGYLGFVTVFSVALVVGIADVVSLAMIQGAEPSHAAKAPEGLAAIARGLAKPLANAKYLRYLVFTFLFFFLLAVSSAFTGLYQIKYLKLDYSFIAVINMANYAIMIATTKLWGRVEERIGRARLLVICAVLMAMEFLVYAFLTQGTLWLIALSPVLAGLGNSGYWACTLPYRYDLMPEDGKMAYEGWYWFVFGASGLLGALCGGSLQNILPEVPTPLLTFSVFQILYLFSGITAIAVSLGFGRMARKDAPDGQGMGVAR